MVERPLKGVARKLMRVGWWLVTPWQLPSRVRRVRERVTARNGNLELDQFFQRDAQRKSRVASGLVIEAATSVSLLDDAALAAMSGVQVATLRWAPVAPEEVVDVSSAARFCIDLWRTDAGVRTAFPRAFGAEKAQFATWIREQGGAELGLSPAAREHIVSVLNADFGRRARQHFLAGFRAHTAFPEGLTPVGSTALLRWFIRHGASAGQLSSQEYWWLLLEAEQDPQRELVLAYLFAPAWQLQHPEALTVFGREAFASWFAANYGASGAWLDTKGWPEWQTPAVQLRMAYWARIAWREAHPCALSKLDAARRFLSWLASPESALPAALQAWCAQLDVGLTAAELVQPGVNVIGHFCYPSGLRVSAESLVHGMQEAGIQVSLRDLRTDLTDEPRHVHYEGMECHDITIIHTQPDPFFASAYALADLTERMPRTYRIAYWYWEFDSIPATWLEQAKDVDEVWAATEFVARGLRERLPLPVRTLFPGVRLAPFEARERRHFGLDRSKYTFLFTFHMMSVMERKNPLGLIRAFRNTFRPDEPVQLVLKTSSGERHPSQLQALRDAAAGANIVVINEVYSASDVLALIDCCDAYVSLHRSEGLGLTMAEAMLLGKPVVATNFSGNVDFMDDSNSLLVPYEIVTLEEAIPPYGSGLHWAQPSETHAAAFMRKLFENPAWGRELGERARASARVSTSLEAAGARVRARLEEIRAARTSIR